MWRKVNILKSSSKSRARSPWIVRWRPGDGSYPQRAFPNRYLAEDFARQMAIRINSGEFIPVAGLSLAELEREFLAAKPDLSPGSIKVYREVWAEFQQVVPEITSEKINIRHVDTFKKAQDCAPATINKKLRHLAAILAWAKSRGYTGTVVEVAKIAEPKRRRTVWTPEQFQKVYDKFAHPEWKMLMLLALNGVGRKNSIIQLARQNVDLKQNTIKCYDQKQKEDRTTPLHPLVAKYLKSYLKSLPAEQQRLFTIKFSNTTWASTVKTAGVPLMTFHHLRSCLSSWLQQKGVSPGVVRDIFGHSDQRVTDHYTEIGLEAKKEAIAKLPLNLKKE